MQIEIKKAKIKNRIFLAYEYIQKDHDVENKNSTSSDAPIHDDLGKQESESTQEDGNTKALPTFEKITRKNPYALNNSYFKNRLPTNPRTPLECLYYFKQHGELPFDIGGDTEHWIYECFVEYQKRAGVFGSQFFTPPATAERMAELAEEYFDIDYGFVLDACCGFGMLTKSLIKRGFRVNGFDINKELLELYNEYTECLSEVRDINAYEFQGISDQQFNIISNPPYEIKECTQFLKLLWDLLANGGTAILLLPKNFIDKDKPKALVEVLQNFNVIHREDMQEDFARTGVKAEIVVLRKS